MKQVISAFALLALIAAGGCGMQMVELGMIKGKNMANVSLYDRLGGKPAITAVIDEFTARVAADNRINHYFAKTDINKFKAHLVDQICEVSGGPCKYTGRTMPETHKGMKISDEEFGWTGAHLAGALDKFSVPDREKNELLQVIGSLQNQIVGL